MADPLRKLADSEAVVAFPEQLLPGSFVKLEHHPTDLPAFELIRCQGRRCWVRQQAWRLRSVFGAVSVLPCSSTQTPGPWGRGWSQRLLAEKAQRHP